MGDGQRERIRRVSGFGGCGQSQNSGHHRGDLRLLCASIPRHLGFDLVRRVHGDWNAALFGKVHDDAAHLSDTHHTRKVLLREDALKRDRRGLFTVEESFNCGAELVQSLGDACAGRALQYLNMFKGNLTPRARRDHTDSAPCQPGIDAHHSHDAYRSRTVSVRELFVVIGAKLGLYFR